MNRPDSDGLPHVYRLIAVYILLVLDTATILSNLLYIPLEAISSFAYSHHIS